jgi:ribosomal protein S14
MECQCGCGGITRKDNIFICGHNRRHKEGWSLDGKWSMKYESCSICGTTKIKHRANGLCRNCYRDNFYKNYDWKEKVCIKCGKNDKVYKAKGLCGNCYNVVRDRKKGIQERRFGAWSQLYDECQLCKTTNRPHAGRGYCEDCIKVSERAGTLTECPVCKVPVLKLNQHLSMRSRKCDLHRDYLYTLFKKYFDSDLNLDDIGLEVGTDRHTITRNFTRLFGKEATKERNEKIRRCNISEKAVINKNYKNIFGTPTFYESKENGLVKFRSKIEAKYATQLDEKGISWRYESAHFPYINKEGIRKTYTPDFFLPEENKYIEIKSSDLYDEDDEYKVEWVKDHTPINIEVVFMK